MPQASDFATGSGLDDVNVDRVRFFVIKSYSEDDVHKSIKYGCWTSTAQGNARLDDAFKGEDGLLHKTQMTEARGKQTHYSVQEAQEAAAEGEGNGVDSDAHARPAWAVQSERSGIGKDTVVSDGASPRGADEDVGSIAAADKADAAAEARGDDMSAGASTNAGAAGAAPIGRVRIILLFSVNSSGHFCGVAEMISPVDHELRADFWQQDKWPGCFKVRWHIVKDVPMTMLRHIRLVSSDKKPVTNSRDTQEVEAAQGMLVLNIFREYRGGTTLLDDFDFYGEREKARSRLRRNHGMYGYGGRPGGHGSRVSNHHPAYLHQYAAYALSRYPPGYGGVPPAHLSVGAPVHGGHAGTGCGWGSSFGWEGRGWHDHWMAGHDHGGRRWMPGDSGGSNLHLKPPRGPSYDDQPFLHYAQHWQQQQQQAMQTRTAMQCPPARPREVNVAASRNTLSPPDAVAAAKPSTAVTGFDVESPPPGLTFAAPGEPLVQAPERPPTPPKHLSHPTPAAKVGWDASNIADETDVPEEGSLSNNKTSSALLPQWKFGTVSGGEPGSAVIPASSA